MRSLAGLKSCGQELGLCVALLPECGPRVVEEETSKECVLPTKNTWLKNPLTVLCCAGSPQGTILSRKASQ